MQHTRGAIPRGDACLCLGEARGGVLGEVHLHPLHAEVLVVQREVDVGLEQTRHLEARDPRGLVDRRGCDEDEGDEREHGRDPSERAPTRASGVRTGGIVARADLSLSSDRSAGRAAVTGDLSQPRSARGSEPEAGRRRKPLFVQVAAMSDGWDNDERGEVERMLDDIGAEEAEGLDDWDGEDLETLKDEVDEDQYEALVDKPGEDALEQ